MPAIHLRKEEVGRLFEERLGTQRGNADPTYLTAPGAGPPPRPLPRRRTPRSQASTSRSPRRARSSCARTRGTADLGVHLARVQIHSMGIEKVIPRREHLGVFVRLLGRSATGQAATVYTAHHRRAPPAPGRGPGRDARRDRGQRADGAAGAPPLPGLAQSASGAGPASTRARSTAGSGGHSYGSTVPGPIGSVLTPGLDLKQYAALPFASTLCGSCTAVCPVKIDLDAQLYAWRQEVTAAGLAPRAKALGMRLSGAALARPSLFAPARADGALGAPPAPPRRHARRPERVGAGARPAGAARPDVPPVGAR